MSAETVSSNTGTVQAAVRRRAIVLRTFVSGTDSTSPVDDRRPAVAAGARRRSLGALDVLGDDAAVGAGAAHGRELDAALAGDATRERAGLDAAFGPTKG